MAVFADFLLSFDRKRLAGGTLEVRDWIAAGRERGASENEVVSHVVTDEPIRQIIEGMATEHIDAAFRLFRPSLPNYTLQIPNWLFYTVRSTSHSWRIDAFRREGDLPARVASYDWPINASVRECRAEWRAGNSVSDVCAGSPAEAANFVLQVLCQATMALAVPGLFESAEISASSKLQKARKRRGREPLVDHIILTISRPKSAVGSHAQETEADKIGRVRHQVIGHFRTISTEGMAPKLAFVRPHWRGTRDAGVRVKDYAVRSDSSFRPIATSEAC